MQIIVGVAVMETRWEKVKPKIKSKIIIGRQRAGQMERKLGKSDGESLVNLSVDQS